MSSSGWKWQSAAGHAGANDPGVRNEAGPDIPGGVPGYEDTARTWNPSSVFTDAPANDTDDAATFTSSNEELNKVFTLMERSAQFAGQRAALAEVSAPTSGHCRGVSIQAVRAPLPRRQIEMSRVVANVLMSLDGFIANEVGLAGGPFGWMGSGDAGVPTAGEGKFRMSLARESRPTEGEAP